MDPIKLLNEIHTDSEGRMKLLRVIDWLTHAFPQLNTPAAREAFSDGDVESTLRKMPGDPCSQCSLYYELGRKDERTVSKT